MRSPKNMFNPETMCPALFRYSTLAYASSGKRLPRRYVTWFALLTAALVLVISTGNTERVSAQSGTGWAEPTVLYQYTDTTESTVTPINRPTIIADSAGGLHLFWAIVSPPEESAIFYMYGDGQTWSNPVDILVGPNRTQTNSNASVALDSQGFLHVIWQNSGLYYSRAHLSQAGTALGWSTPELIAPSSLFNALFVDHDGMLHVAFTTGDASNDVFYTRLDRDMPRWSDPIQVSQTDNDQATGNPAILVTPDGALHIAWGSFQKPQGWPPTGTFYARSLDNGESWQDVVQLGADSQGVPALFGLNTSLHLVWLRSLPGRFYSISDDNGATWRPVQPLTPEVSGLLVGSPQFSLDSAEQLHLCMGGAYGGLDDVILCSQWSEDSWQPLARVTNSVEGGESSPGLAITGGNRLHLVWFRYGTNDIIYTYRDTRAPAVPLAAQAALEPILPLPVSPTPTTVVAPTATPAKIPTTAPFSDTESRTIGMPFAIGIPTILVCLLLAGVLIIRSRARTR